MKPHPPDLSALHDFFQPPPPSWMPQTAGWYVLAAVLAVLLLWFAIRAARSWRRNRYRREALRALEAAPVAEFSALLKRAALAAWPRERVAALTGEPWLRFLSESSGITQFSSPPGSQMEEAALVDGASGTAAHTEQLRRLAAQWIRRHRVRV
jgi:Domain of unknown function (DUF4381)